MEAIDNFAKKQTRVYMFMPNLIGKYIFKIHRNNKNINNNSIFYIIKIIYVKLLY